MATERNEFMPHDSFQFPLRPYGILSSELFIVFPSNDQQEPRSRANRAVQVPCVIRKPQYPTRQRQIEDPSQFADHLVARI